VRGAHKPGPVDAQRSVDTKLNQIAQRETQHRPRNRKDSKSFAFDSLKCKIFWI
jgi:hypothetical protein